jgi:hypothetical protein
MVGTKLAQYKITSHLGTALIAAISTFFFFGIQPLFATPLPRYGEFVFSSLCWEKQSGDASGFRIRLQRATGGDSLYLEWSEGGLYGPMLASKVTIDSKTSMISFTIPACTSPSDIPESETYRGRITNEEIILEESGSGDAATLKPFRRPISVPRVKDAKGKMTACTEP